MLHGISIEGNTYMYYTYPELVPHFKM